MYVEFMWLPWNGVRLDIRWRKNICTCVYFHFAAELITYANGKMFRFSESLTADFCNARTTTNQELKKILVNTQIYMSQINRRH